MVKVFSRWLKILLIILGIALVAGTIILLVENEPQLDNISNETTDVLAANHQTISNFEC